MSQVPNESRQPTPTPTLLDVAGGIGLGALAICLALAAMIGGEASLATVARAFGSLGLAPAPAGSTEITLARAIEGAGVRSILMLLMGIAAAVGIRLSSAAITRIAGAIGAWVSVGLASLLLGATAVRLAAIPPVTPWLEAVLNTLFGLALIVLGVVLTWVSRRARNAGRFVYPLIAIFFVQVIVLLLQPNQRLDGAFALNLAFAIVIAAAIAALALLGRNQALLAE